MANYFSGSVDGANNTAAAPASAAATGDAPMEDEIMVSRMLTRLLNLFYGVLTLMEKSNVIGCNCSCACTKFRI